MFWVCNLPWLPYSLVLWIVNRRRLPFALVCRVLDHRCSPHPASRNLVTLWIRNARRDPVAIFLVIPIFWLLRLRVGNHQRLILQPVVRLGSVFVRNLKRCILVPVIGLCSIRIGDARIVNPVVWLGIVRVFNLFGWVDGRRKVFKETARFGCVAVNSDLIRLVRPDNKGVEGGEFGDSGQGWCLQMFLLVFSSIGILMPKYEVDLNTN